jgi:serine/threonine protein kinase
MNYLHNQNPPIIHRDLKPQNILLTAAGDAKISDFGLSVSRTSSQTRTKNQVGTCLYSAPEVLDIKRISERGKGVDVFAFGIILFETFTREVPWQKDISEKGYTLEDIKTLIIGGDRPEIQSSFPLPLKELVQFCWNNSPSKRPNFSTILVTLQELSLPQEWKKFFIESGVKEEELKSNDKTTNNVTETLIDLSATVINLEKTKSPFSLSKILEAKNKLKPVKPQQLPNLQELPKDEKSKLADVLSEAIKKRRELVESLKTNKKSSNESTILWSKTQ